MIHTLIYTANMFNHNDYSNDRNLFCENECGQ